MRIPARTIAQRICAALLPSALLLSGTLHSAEAGINVWTTSGPEGGYINALAIDPQAPATVYAGTDSAGVFKSIDGGGTWRAANNGLPNFVVYALAIDPQTPTIVYAGTFNRGGVFKSTDGGETWSPINTGLTDLSVIIALAIDPQVPTTLYAGAHGGGVSEPTHGGGRWRGA